MIQSMRFILVGFVQFKWEYLRYAGKCGEVEKPNVISFGDTS